MVKLNISKDEKKRFFSNVSKLERIKVSNNRTKIVGATESEIQEAKTRLDTLMLFGDRKDQKKASKELRRLGVLHG